ncbi:hypothetical protein CPB84DRAFT_1766025 [Gymnopilus junonius]|uniref:Uncharacterized protein n=1 Tax=Gymnopilus junonius TaxID=109634 RepID=A0A9P5NX53_GYMJU|nr:hypothetical protein CPB84DRAFT_1766025 [Gymnopilus junonius]
MPQLDLSIYLKALAIPPDFTRLESISDQDAISNLFSWKQKASTVLGDLLHILQSKDGENLSLEAKADVLFVSAPFLPQNLIRDEDIFDPSNEMEPWITPEAQRTAQEVVSSPLLSPSKGLVTFVLTHNLKPIFNSSPHPLLHLGTGRRLPRPAGGPMGMHDYYEGQLWKQYPGIDKVVLWCVQSIEGDAYESLWHLVIPPIMAFLDDFEARYKLHGIAIVQEMLRHVPKDLVKRTGVDGLLKQSFRACMSHLQSPETPLLLKKSIVASISLTLLTTSVSIGTKPSSSRFDELSSLLGEGIISGIWLYADDKPEVVKATFDALPPLLSALSIGCVRFFKALIPQLTHVLIPQPTIDSDRKIQLSAIRVLDTLLDVGRPRVEFWKETILDAVGRCWVGLIDESTSMQVNGTSRSSLEAFTLKGDVKEGLQSLCIRLAEVCPSVIENEFPRFIQADRALFEELIPTSIGSVVKA